jgi:hypothetical protein
MSVTFTNHKWFQTTPNSLVGINQSQCSFSLLLRGDNLGSGTPNSAWCYVVFRGSLNPYYFLLSGTTTTGVVKLTGAVQNAAGTWVTGAVTIPQGDVIHVAMTYDQGTQTFWANGVPIAMGTLTGNTYSANAYFAIGGDPVQPAVYTLSDVAVWNGYVLTATEVRNLRDGTQTPADIGGSATWRGRWTLSGTVGATVALGDAGLANSFGDSTTNLTTASGSGTAVYAAPLVWTPTVKVKEAHIGSSGETLFLYLSTIATGVEAFASSEIIRPTLYVNGSAVGTLGTPWISGHHHCFMYPMPPGVVVGKNDTVTFSSSSGWLNTTMGLARAETTIPVTNYAGRGVYSTKYPARTLRMGVNIGHPPTHQCLYNIPKNWLMRASTFAYCTLDSTGKPIAMQNTTAGCSLTATAGSNLIDNTEFPGPTGLFAVGWDDTNPGSPTLFYLYAILTTTTVVERTDLRNYGTNGLGQVRVFQVSLTPGSAAVTIDLGLGMSNAAKTPQFANLVVYGPGDFNSVAPVVLDKSDPLAPSASFLHWMGIPPGSIRWPDSMWSYDAAGTDSEREDMHNMTDFGWGIGYNKRNSTIKYVQARPFALPGYIYSKHFGSSFPATLAADIDAVTTTLTIPDAATAPVFTGLQLTIDSEKMLVMDVSGTTVTVQRGTSSTTAARHSAGTISVNNRFQITSYDQLSLSHSGCVAEFMTQDPHKLRSGNVVGWQGGGWPSMTYTDGTVVGSLAGYSRVMFVTGPNSYVFSIGNSKAAPVTLSTTYTLDPANQQSAYQVPEVGFAPEFAAKTTGLFPGCDLQFNVPFGASDDMVYELARRVRDNFPAGRNVWVETANETWRDPACLVWYGTVGNCIYPGVTGRPYWVQRIGEIRQIFRTVFAAGGTDRSAEVKMLLGCAQMSPSDSATQLGLAQTQGVTIDGLAVACYIGPDYGTTATVTAYDACDAVQAIDLLVHDFAESTVALLALRASDVVNINNYNAATGNNCVLYAYEGGVNDILPASLANYKERGRDMVYHPNWYFAEQDFYALFQHAGYQRVNIYAQSMEYPVGCFWGMYHGIQQDYGRGDGSDGKTDNRLCQATPGQPHTKSATTNLDLTNVSVRGQAFLDWNKLPARRKPRYAPYRSR